MKLNKVYPLIIFVCLIMTSITSDLPDKKINFIPFNTLI